MSTTPFGKDNFFYEAQIRQCVALFGAIFSDIYIQRGDDFIKVPIRQSGGYMYEKTPQSADFRESTKTGEILPALAYSFGVISKDTTRTTQRFQGIESEKRMPDGSSSIIYGRVPYNITFTLTLRSKHLTEDLQILEQICGVFAPSITVSVNPLASVLSDALKQETVIVLEDVGALPEEFDTEEESKRYEREYQFTLKTYLYPRVQRAYVIDEIVVSTSLENLDTVLNTQSISNAEEWALSQAVADLEISSVVAKKPRKARK